MYTQRGKLLQNFMSPYIPLRLEPEPPCAPALSCLRSRLALRRGTQCYLYYLEHVRSAQPHSHQQPPQCPSVWGLMTVYENLIFNPPDVQFVHHRRTSALFSPPTVYKLYSSSILLPTYGSLRTPSYGLHVVHWRVPTEYLGFVLRTHQWRLLMTT